MPDIARPESANVEQIMEQIRARIREKRGVDDSEQQVRELAAAKLDKLFEQVRRSKPIEPAPNYTFDRETLVESPSGLIRAIRRLLRPLLRLFVNSDAIADALRTQSQLNARQAEIDASRHRLYDELIHNLVIESARLGLEVKQMKMRVESLASRLEFSERRTRTLESTLTYKPAVEERYVQAPAMAPPTPPPPPQPSSPPSPPPSSAPLAAGATESQPQPGPQPMAQGPSGAPLSDGQRRRRRRRRRGRRRGGLGAPMGSQPAPTTQGGPQTGGLPADTEAPQSVVEQAQADTFAEEVEPDEGSADGEGDADPSTGSGPGDSGEPDTNDQ